MPSGDDWIGCSLGIKSFVLTYNPINSPNDTTSIDVADSNARQVTIHSLSLCTTYEFVIRITNRDEQGPDSSVSNATTNSYGKKRIHNGKT